MKTGSNLRQKTRSNASSHSRPKTRRPSHHTIQKRHISKKNLPYIPTFITHNFIHKPSFRSFSTNIYSSDNEQLSYHDNNHHNDNDIDLYAPTPNIISLSPSHVGMLRQQLDKPLSASLGKESYEMKAVTGLNPSFHPNPLISFDKKPVVETLPENADVQEIFAALIKEQQVELETELKDVIDEEKRSYIIYQSSVNFQKRLQKIRMARRDRSRALTKECETVLTRMKQHGALNLLTLISLLRQLSFGRDPNLRLYRVDNVSALHSYMVFHTARDAAHLNIIADAVVDFVRSNPQFQRNIDNEVSTESSHHELATSQDQGKATGQLLIFSRNEIPWRMLDLGSTLLQLSYGPERKISNTESILKPTEIDLSNASQFQSASNVKLTKCLEITPLSILEQGLNKKSPKH